MISERAARAALSMQRALAELNRKKAGVDRPHRHRNWCRRFRYTLQDRLQFELGLANGV
jgi:hypothetical protein